MKQVFKVVRESNYNVSALKIIDKLKSMDANYTVTEESEEPDIDFDALYDEWAEKPMDWSESRSPYDQARSFRDFLKSKNLTAPNPVEIPVKKYWTLKEKFKPLLLSYGIRTIEVETELQLNIVEFYDHHEEPDYSKIPKGSIVVVSTKDDKIKSAEVVDHFDSNHIYCNGGVSYELKYVKIRIVELAKDMA